MLNKMKTVFGGKNKIISLIFAIVLMIITTGVSFAATSVRLQQPQSPTSNNTFSITFVALDTDQNPVTVQCQKKGPGEGSFTDFGPAYNLSNGGNTGNCQVTSAVVTTEGAYQFKAVGNGVDSNVVTVNYSQSSAPGTPTNYKKEKISSCDYKISFRTANDSGKTSKVRLYRSTETKFGIDSAHQVGEIAIGSDQDGSIQNNVPDCGATYYFAIRAFDSAGNGSGIAGDENINTVVINPANTQSSGAIPVSNNNSGNTIGTVSDDTVSPTNKTEGEASKEVLGAEDVQIQKGEQNPISSGFNWITGHKKITLTVIAFLAIGTYLVLRYRKNKVQ